MSILESETLVGNKRLPGSAFRLGDVEGRERASSDSCVLCVMILGG